MLARIREFSAAFAAHLEDDDIPGCLALLREAAVDQFAAALHSAALEIAARGRGISTLPRNANTAAGAKLVEHLLVWDDSAVSTTVSPIYAAIEGRNVAALQLLLGDCRSGPGWMLYPIHTAVASRDPAIVEAVVEDPRVKEVPASAHGDTSPGSASAIWALVTSTRDAEVAKALARTLLRSGKVPLTDETREILAKMGICG